MSSACWEPLTTRICSALAADGARRAQVLGHRLAKRPVAHRIAVGTIWLLRAARPWRPTRPRPDLQGEAVDRGLADAEGAPPPEPGLAGRRRARKSGARDTGRRLRAGRRPAAARPAEAVERSPARSATNVPAPVRLTK